MNSSKVQFLAFLLAFCDARAWACAVCGFGEGSRQAFFSTTFILTLVPLILMGLIFWAVLKRALAPAGAGESSERGDQELSPQLKD